MKSTYFSGTFDDQFVHSIARGAAIPNSSGHAHFGISVSTSSEIHQIVSFIQMK
jgi:hypothetical protein